MQSRPFNGPYAGKYLDNIAFPMGGMGAGMICIEGTGALSHFSLRHHPDVHNEPNLFAAISALEDGAAERFVRVLEGPVPKRKIFRRTEGGRGAERTTYGLPRFREASFSARFPFGTATLKDPDSSIEVEVTGWSPFIPGDSDSASYPVAGVEYRFVNRGGNGVDAVFSFNTHNFMARGWKDGSVDAAPAGAGTGFVLKSAGTEDEPWSKGAFCATTDDPAATANCLWFRGGWWDPLTMAWRDVERGHAISRPPVNPDDQQSPGATLFVPFRLEPGQEKVVRLMLSWYVPESNLRTGRPLRQYEEGQRPAYAPWYAARFKDIGDVASHWRATYDDLREKTERFTACFYDTTLPPEVVEAVAANLTILKSPTVLRQTDGRLWCWEGCSDREGSCSGSCTHVWNYAQALPHLFPDLERSLRATEFGESQDERGHQMFRAALPIEELVHNFHAASDGQLGGIMKMHRDWRISGDTEWLRGMWPLVKLSLNYCIETWDPDRIGALVEPHHNTYDIEFWGPDGMCTSFYLGALRAAVEMGEALGDDVEEYRTLLERGRTFMESELFDGEYFIQKIEWDPDEVESLRKHYSPEALELLEKEGPKYQYGVGCLSDGVLGAWIADVCGVPPILDQEKVASHLMSVYRYNMRRDLTLHVNPQRPGFAVGDEGGLLLCSWPKGGALSLPFVYSNEVWTGIEYQVASHLLRMGKVEEGLDIVRACRLRYDGRIRNPFNEYECGHWYARAMASYALIYGLTGISYDAVTKTLYVDPRIEGDFKSFLSTASGFGTAGIRIGEPFVDVVDGEIVVEKVVRGPRQ